MDDNQKEDFVKKIIDYFSINYECNMKDGLHHGEYINYIDGEVVSSKQNYNMGVRI